MNILDDADVFITPIEEALEKQARQIKTIKRTYFWIRFAIVSAGVCWCSYFVWQAAKIVIEHW